MHMFVTEHEYREQAIIQKTVQASVIISKYFTGLSW